MAMKKKGLKARWMAALTGGKYKQGRGQLKVEQKHGKGALYCCLGVLCDISPAVAARNDCGVVLALVAREYVGISLAEMNQLVDLNDGGDNGFKRIANWIEKNL